MDLFFNIVTTLSVILGAFKIVHVIRKEFLGFKDSIVEEVTTITHARLEKYQSQAFDFCTDNTSKMQHHLNNYSNHFERLRIELDHQGIKIPPFRRRKDDKKD